MEADGKSSRRLRCSGRRPVDPRKSKACPAGSIYGKARATSPLLDAPLEGPVYLRSSNHPLPDLVPALQEGPFGQLPQLCSHANRATVQFTGQNAKTHDFRPLLRDSCKAPKPGRRGRG
jgi:hypothetical protein